MEKNRQDVIRRNCRDQYLLEEGRHREMLGLDVGPTEASARLAGRSAAVDPQRCSW